LRILIIDDERLAAEDLEYVIKKAEPAAETVVVTSPEEGLVQAGKFDPDIVFSDIEMPGINGIELVRRIKEKSPKTNIIMVTAFSQFALDALKLYVSDYILKPAKIADVKRALANLRTPLDAEAKYLLKVQCFGNFEVFKDGTPLHFSRSKTKELFAYLVNLKGSSADTRELCDVLWENDNPETKDSYLRHLLADLRRSLEEVSCTQVINASKNSYAVMPELLDCDYYHYLEGDENAKALYKGEYMKQYDWSYMTLSEFLDKE